MEAGGGATKSDCNVDPCARAFNPSSSSHIRQINFCNNYLRHILVDTQTSEAAHLWAIAMAILQYWSMYVPVICLYIRIYVYLTPICAYLYCICAHQLVGKCMLQQKQPDSSSSCSGSGGGESATD